MNTRPKIALAAAIVGLGVAGAWLFRLPNNRPGAAAGPPAAAVAAPLSIAVASPLPLIDDAPRRAPPSLAGARPLAEAAPPSVAVSRLADEAAPPELPNEFLPRVPAPPRPAPKTPPPASARESSSTAGESDSRAAPSTGDEPSNGALTPVGAFAAPDRVAHATEPAAPRWHRVVDGDSLASLAARYLGDAQAAARIHDANRDLLADPEILPLGLKLRIPSREAP